MAGFRESLRQAVRQIAFRTSVDSLKKRGVDRVSVLGIDRMVALIEEAVHKSLRSRLVGIDREAVADATKAEFLRLLRSHEDLQREKSELERLKERAEEEVDAMRRELQAQRRALEQRLAEGDLRQAGRYDGDDARIAEQVREVVRAVAGSDGVAPGMLEQRVLELVMASIAGERRSAEEARRALRDREVDNLRRRIQKLSQSLEQTEHRLRHVSAMKDIDEGISSVYREVQGLQPGDTAFARKRELMSAIFQANMRLQKRVDG